jgi:hypothetical protein
MPKQIGRVSLTKDRGLTLNEERTVDRPRDCRDHNYDHISVPNGDTDSLHEHLLQGEDRITEGKDIHSEHDQK